MSATTAIPPFSRQVASSPASRLAVLARLHPLVAYFTLAYVFTWLLVVPIAISQRGVAWVTLPDPLPLVLFIGASFVGPLPAAFVLTGLIEGRSGVRALLLRMVQWRVGIGWVCAGHPCVSTGGASRGERRAGSRATEGAAQQSVPAGFDVLAWYRLRPRPSALGEEPGWRGFALPRLQRLYGPLLASLILGVLHALWHTTAYFVRGAISDNGFDLGVFVGNSLEIVAFTFIWTWLFNSASGSVLFAMLVHATSNATSQLLDQLLNVDVGVWGRLYPVVLALLVIAATRGQLAYRGHVPGQPDERRPR